MADILLGQSAADTYFSNAYSGYRLKVFSTCAGTDSIALKLAVKWVKSLEKNELCLPS